MTQPHPPLLAGFDFTALAWAAVAALVFSLSALPTKWRQQAPEDRRFSLFWTVIVETVIGGLVGGIVFALALPEWVPRLRGQEGTLAALSVAGAALGPHLGQWIVRAAPQVIPALIQRLTGLKVTLDVGKEEVNDAEKKG